MLLKVLRAKIHRATITEACVDYVGSITIDKDLLDASGILPGECVLVADLTDGQRFETYVFEGEAGSGVICVNGAAARLVDVGDKVIIMAYGYVSHEEAKTIKPSVVLVNDDNKIDKIAQQALGQRVSGKMSSGELDCFIQDHMHQIIIDLGTLKFLGFEIPLRIFGYGLMLVFGFLSGIFLARWRARRAGENPDAVSQCAIMALIGGVLGARILYVCLYWDKDFLDSAGNFRFFELLNVTSGGLVYFGGLLGGTITVLGYIFYKKLPVRRFIDILAPSLMIGLAFGRMGCTLNGCCWGGPCEASWALGMKFPMISKPLIKVGGDPNNPYSPTQGMSPTFAHQYWNGEVQPDARLLNQFMQLQPNDDKVYGDGKASVRQAVLPVDQLHGQLAEDQLTIILGSQAAARKAFDALAGPGGSIGKEEWDEALAREDKTLLRGSEAWDEARQFDHSENGRLDFEELWFYMQDRKRLITARFDADDDGTLTGLEYEQANKYLQADTFKILTEQWSNPRKPAQVLGIINGFLLAGLLLAFYRYRTREGQVFALMLILYPITRFLLESVRHDDPLNVLHGNWTHNQISSMFMIAGGLGLWWILSRLSPSAGPVLAERQALALQAADRKALTRKRK